MTLRPPEPQTIVIFGASGDLTRRKIVPALYNLFRQNLLPETFALVGYARSEMTMDAFRARLREGIENNSRSGCETGVWARFSERIRYLAGDVASEGDMKHLRDELDEVARLFGCGTRKLFYCATPPGVFAQVAARIGEEGLADESRIVIEKPFGENLESARDLNALLHRVFSEDQIFRIDHYLGKETVQNILAFRFSNGMFEPIWNRRYVTRAELNVAEDIGIEGRGKFYDGAGAVRDIVQNHLLQLLAILTMEPPSSFRPESIRDEKVKLLHSIPPVDPGEIVRGQYRAGSVGGSSVASYVDEPHVSPGSTTATFVAMKLGIENWRWAGVPFFLRTGKRLTRRATTVTVVFHDAPHMLFEQSGLARPEPNHLTIRIQPDEGISLTFDAKVPGPEMQVAPVEMDFSYEGSFMTRPAEAYERLIHEVMEGDQTLFTRADEIERAWEVVGGILDGGDPEAYAAGSWGPKAAEGLIGGSGWHLR